LTRYSYNADKTSFTYGANQAIRAAIKLLIREKDKEEKTETYSKEGI
jgi:hypothetical protein